MKTETEIFCENIKKIRKKYNLSLSAMAKKLGVGIASIRKLENGILPPKMKCDVIFRVRDNFGIEPKDIFKPIK